MKKIFVTRKMDENIFKSLIDLGYVVDVNDEHLSDKEELKKIVKEYDAIITTVGCEVDKEIINEAGDQLKIVATASVGYDHIDVLECKNKNIYVTNTPGANAWCVAEHTVGLILNLTHSISESDRFVRKGEFHGFSFGLFVGDEIKDNTIGIVGLGNIGKNVSKILKNGFGSNICYYDCKRDEEFEKEFGIKFISSLDELMKISDVVSVHVPLCEETKYLINENNLKLMKNTSYLVNTSRGPVVNEKDLISVLKDKTIRGAALDVFENEPVISPELFDMDNVILTPHIAASSEEAHKNMIDMAIKNVIEAMSDSRPSDLVKELLN